MLTYANEQYKDDYEVLYAFDSDTHEGFATYTYLIRERHTNRLALLENCAMLDTEFFTREDFDECRQLVADYTK
jgi:hypothetical protein